MSSKLEQLKKYTVVVADTGEVMSIKKYSPQDCTTNPSLIYKAAARPEYQSIVDSAVAWAKTNAPVAGEDRVSNCIDKLAVRFGSELTKLVPGYVSTEVDAKLSFDRDAMVRKAEKIIALYAEEGVGKERILVKVAATWEGIRAAEILEKRGIHCNLTLVFCLAQAVACADAGGFLISPFVGRITDWYKKAMGKDSFAIAEDPGVNSVKTIYNYFKQHKYETVVMGASFRSAAQVEALAGCDRLTVSPALLEELENDKGTLECQLSASNTGERQADVPTDEASFRWLVSEDAMATEKLHEGIRLFHQDYTKLAQMVAEKLR